MYPEFDSTTTLSHVVDSSGSLVLFCSDSFSSSPLAITCPPSISPPPLPPTHDILEGLGPVDSDDSSDPTLVGSLPSSPPPSYDSLTPPSSRVVAVVPPHSRPSSVAQYFLTFPLSSRTHPLCPSLPLLPLAPSTGDLPLYELPVTVLALHVPPSTAPCLSSSPAFIG